MGPIVDPVRARPRWLALLVLSYLSLAAFALLRRPAPTPPAAAFDLDAIARAHRLWVADHGTGCARSPEHFVGYLTEEATLDLRDPWGSPLAYECVRSLHAPKIVVELRSAGPDRIHGTTDDLRSVDVQQL